MIMHLRYCRTRMCSNAHSPPHEQAVIPSMDEILLRLSSCVPAAGSSALRETFTWPRASRPRHMTLSSSPSAKMSSTLFTCSSQVYLQATARAWVSSIPCLTIC